jgi:predicted nucleic acid-binding protein
MKKTIYVETSIVSYLTARPSGDLLAAANQKATADWWDTKRDRFKLYVSDLVLEEAGRGDPVAAARRLAALVDLTVLPIEPSALALAESLIEEVLPKRAIDDALHVAVSAVHGIDFLITWNCRHIDNAEIKPIIRDICTRHSLRCPEICTPHELMGVDNDGR